MKTTCLFIILLSVTSLVAQQVSSEVDALVSPKRTDLVITVGGADADITGFDNKAIQFAIDAVTENGGTACPSLLKVKDSVKLYDVKVLLKTGRGMMPSFLVLPEENRRAV